jgi:hypothetical protein
MDKETAPTGLCKKCGKIVDKDQVYCSQCTIALAEENITEPSEDTQKQPLPARSRTKVIAQWIVLLVCLTIIAFQMQKMFTAFKGDQPIRHGTYETDAQTDQCINNLWHISKLLQEGKLPGNDIVCPASGKQYAIVTVREDTGARCPNPELHGFREISVSRHSPCPEVK